MFWPENPWDATAEASGAFAQKNRINMKYVHPDAKSWRRVPLGDEAYATTTFGRLGFSDILLRVQNVIVEVITEDGDTGENAHDRLIDQQNRAQRVASELTAALNRLRR
ncbi:hypothetical protein ACFPM5_20635 [Actinomadura harenae]|nr:hypothetical protein [Actinomadura harenae]